MINEIRKAHELRKAQIVGAFKNVENNPKDAQIITKSDFEAQFPEAQFERYSLKSLTAFRDQLEKSEDVTDKIGSFKEATKDLKHFLVVENGHKQPMFVRKKVAGE